MAGLIRAVKALPWENEMDKTSLKHTLLSAMLPHVPFDGWSARSLDMARRDAGVTEPDVARAFPGGHADALEYFMQRLDEGMREALAQMPLAEMKLHEKVQAAIMLRLKASEPFREAVRKALAYYAMPFHAGEGMKRLYTTTDAIWRAIGDHPTDFSFYTKRLSLAAIYSSTLLFWLDDYSDNSAETLAFLQRRLKNLFTFHQFKKKLADNPISRRFAATQ